MNPIYLETIVVCIGMFLLLVEAFVPKLRKEWIGYAAIIGLLGVFGLTFLANPGFMNPSAGYFSLYVADSTAIFFKQFALLATALVILLALEYRAVFERYIPGVSPGAGVAEYYSLAIFACAGMMWLVSAVDFILLFVALELMTITFYVLVAYLRKNSICLEAGVKYLILGALSTGILIYGITWIFGMTGTTNLLEMRRILPELPGSMHVPLLFGLAFVLVALGFKVAAFPFQFWVPDVYQGSPTPTTAFLSIASKAAGFVVLLRVLEPFLATPVLREKILPVLAVLAGATMIFANLAVLPQTNFKRLLAYSSVAHAGYLLMGVASLGSILAGPAIAFYLGAYFIMTFLAFGVLLVVSRAVGGDDLSDFRGLAKRSPFLAALLTIAVLAMAGLPFTVGFFGKFFLFAVALEQGLYALVVIGTISVACGFYFYLKVIRAMYWQEPVGETEIRVAISPLLAVVLTILAILTLILGVYPAPLFAAIL
jgi:NADH-quinone oxidoreductase subunit N